MRHLILTVGLLVTAAVDAAQMDIETYNNLRRGMHESEVLMRAGEPDRVTTPGGVVISGGHHRGLLIGGGSRVEFHYLPDAAEHDPWLTVVVLTGGRVSALERRKMIGRAAAGPADDAPRPATAGDAVSRSDHDIRIARAERTLRAAQHYADVRWRIQERTGGDDVPRSTRVYHGTDDFGARYFGDVALPRDTSRAR